MPQVYRYPLFFNIANGKYESSDPDPANTLVISAPSFAAGYGITWASTGGQLKDDGSIYAQGLQLNNNNFNIPYAGFLKADDDGFVNEVVPLLLDEHIAISANIQVAKLETGTEGYVLKVVSGVPTWSVSTGGGTVTSVTGTSPIASSGGTAPNITLNTVPINKGGTGNTTASAAFSALSPTAAKGDLIAHNGSGDVALNVGTNGQVLTVDLTTATGLKWSSAASGSVTDVTATSPLTSSGGSTPNIALGTVPVNKGGTNFASYTSGDLLYASGTTTLSKLGIGATNQVLTVVAGAPAWASPAAQFTGAGVGYYRAVSTATASVTTATDYVLDVTYTLGCTITLPACTGLAGRIFVIKNSGSGASVGTVTVNPTTPATETIDGATSLTIAAQYASYTFMCTGSKWILI